jgi:hypothetical protein
MGGRGGSGRSSAAVIQVPAGDANAMADLDIRDAYDDALNIKGNTGNRWVTLQALRTALSVRGMSRERQDRELTRFANERKGILLPEEIQRTLTPGVRDAGLRYGGEINHLFQIER